MGVTNVLVYSTFSTIKAFLVYYFWKLGLKYIEILNRIEDKKGIITTKILITFAAVYLISMYLIFVIFWSVPTIYKF